MVYENNVGLILMLCCFKVNSKVQADHYFGKPEKREKEPTQSTGRLGSRISDLRDESVVWPEVVFAAPDNKVEFTVQVVDQKYLLQG